MLQFAKDEWCRQLSNFTAEEIKHGLDSYRGQFAPNVVQFVDACASREKLPAPCYKDFDDDRGEHIGIGKIKASPDTVKNSLDEIKKFL